MPCASPIPAINLLRYKSTVARLIVTIVVPTINLQSFGIPIAHRPIVERSKRFTPFFANRYSSFAIVFEGVVYWVITPTDHVYPNRMNRILFAGRQSRKSVCGQLFATTAFSVSLPYIVNVSAKLIFAFSTKKQGSSYFLRISCGFARILGLTFIKNRFRFF